MNIYNYYYWNNIISSKDIKNINSIITKNKMIEDESVKAKNAIKTSTVYTIKLKKFNDLLKVPISYIVESNQQNYGYDIFNFSEEMFLHVNIYKKNQEYNWHNDANPSNFSDIKLTALINISDENYKGGEFFLELNKEPVNITQLNNPGSMVVFNSFIYHKVNPVLTGTRKTLAIFIKGPCFK